MPYSRIDGDRRSVPLGMAVGVPAIVVLAHVVLEVNTRLWVLAPLALAVFCWIVWLYWTARRTRLRAKANQCPRCGYDLRGTPDGCPECGVGRE